MKMSSMKITAAAREKMAEPCLTSDMPKYPWGLSITLDNDALKALGLKTMPDVDDVQTLVARVVVTAVSSNESTGGDGPRRSVSLQITDMGLDANDPTEKPDAGKKLYT